MFHTKLWVLDRSGHHYTCYLVDCGPYGIEARINRDGAELYSWRFSKGADAVAWAANERVELERKITDGAPGTMKP